MAIPDDKVALTVQGRRVPAFMVDSAGRDPAPPGALTARSSRTRLYFWRVTSFAYFLLFAAGAVLTLAPFATWRAIVVFGVAIQAIGLWMVVFRWAPTIGVGVRKWSKYPQLPARSGSRV
jgi:hypothetical protein